jgi:two-component system, cell cycle sensor histidine kinase and response regulator CckA
MLPLLKVSLSKHAAIISDLDRDLPPIRAGAAQVRQILMNLVTNASDAIEGRDGTIRVTTRRVRTADGPAIPEAAAERDYLALEVCDTGSGMSLETQAKVFDPFFTTKSAGRGLGLAVVSGIVRGLGGTIRLTSELDKGTTFRILLPSAEAKGKAANDAPPAAEPAAKPAEAFVLIVEDENYLREAVAKVLRKTGYEVCEAADGDAAIDLLRANRGKIDVILLDMTIPGASSEEVVAEATKSNPDTRVILTSAYSQEMFADAVSAPQVRSFIRKPFRLADLVKTLRRSVTS